MAVPIANIMEPADWQDREMERLEAENAKLRELVKDMFRDFANADAELKQRHGRTFMAWVRYERRLRELGVDA